MKRIPLVLTLAGALLFWAGCETDQTRDDTLMQDTVGVQQGETARDVVNVEGTVTYVDLEGGFYGIEGDDGNRYNPVNLDQAYAEDGLRVRISGEVRTDVATAQMWGQPLEIEQIERL
jgi:hypothetical protein